jgi:hypothetical protein
VEAGLGLDGPHPELAELDQPRGQHPVLPLLPLLALQVGLRVVLDRLFLRDHRLLWLGRLYQALHRPHRRPPVIPLLLYLLLAALVCLQQDTVAQHVVRFQLVEEVWVLAVPLADQVLVIFPRDMPLQAVHTPTPRHFFHKLKQKGSETHPNQAPPCSTLQC